MARKSFSDMRRSPAAFAKIREARFGNVSRGRKGDARTMAQAGNGDLAPGEAAGQPIDSSNKRQFRSEPAVGTKEKQTQQINSSAIPRRGAGTTDLKKHDYQSLNSFYEERAGHIRLEGEFVDQSLEVLTGIEGLTFPICQNCVYRQALCSRGLTVRCICRLRRERFR